MSGGGSGGTGPDEAGGFSSAAVELARRQRGEIAPGPVDVEAYIVSPVVPLDRAKQLWNAFFELKDFLLADPACADDLPGGRELNRTGASRLAFAFGLSKEVLRADEAEVVTDGRPDRRFAYRVRVSRGARYADSTATCRISEVPATTKKGDAVPYSQREHFAATKAETRAFKRAVADLLGGTEAE